MTPQLLCVDPSQVDKLWGFIEPFIAKAFASGIGDDTAITVASDVLSGRSVCWLVLDDNRILSVTTTKIIDTPTKRLCVITSCSGENVAEWRHFIGEIERYAASNDCHAVRMMGRLGWKKVFPDYREPWVCLEKQLRD